jgi:elongation factor Ts
MAEITAALVRELRETSGAGMMDCKRALTETEGNLQDAVDWLRKKGLAAAAKKAGRVAAEGLIGVATDATSGAVIEVNSETDFVARNESFQRFVAEVARLGLTAAGLDDLRARPMPGESKNVAEKLTQLIGTIGENLTLRRMAALSVKQGLICSYVHNAVAPGLGRIGVLVGLDSAADAGKLAPFGRQLAMHVAAASPQSLSIADVDPAALERERNVLSEQARASGRPEEIIAKMVEGRLRKYYEDVVLLEQLYVIDGESRVKAAIEKAGREAGAPIQVTGFVRLVLGEGVEREQKDFAAEVAAQLGT